MLIPTVRGAGVQTVTLGLKEALTKKTITTTVLPEFATEQVEQLFLADNLDGFLNNIFAQCELATNHSEVVLINGLSLNKVYAREVNFAIAEALEATVIFVVAPTNNLVEVMRQAKIIINPYKRHYAQRVLGVVFNKANLQEVQAMVEQAKALALTLPCLETIPYKNTLAERIGALHIGAAMQQYFTLAWLWPFLNSEVVTTFTPTMFRHRLLAIARKGDKKIILPEGDEPRTLQAANFCAAQGIARCMLLGNRQAIEQACARVNCRLHESIEIIEPQSIRARYIEQLYEIRREKGLTLEEAQQQIEDNTTLGTMMLHLGEVDGLVAGALHTTAHTIRPALQIIKTRSGFKLVSAIFFMCLPDQVLVYGDCAVNPKPNAEELADIAIQSARSAMAFGITPRVAMLSYSTGDSGVGPDVDKIKFATEMVKQRQPDLLVDGPLQYDAAVDKGVAALKAPNSKVAGQATVFIFPDLNVGNIVYKAVQRSTGIICIGPMLQGLRKPVNDLSRGCSIEDIVFTIAITAVQAIHC